MQGYLFSSLSVIKIGSSCLVRNARFIGEGNLTSTHSSLRILFADLRKTGVGISLGIKIFDNIWNFPSKKSRKLWIHGTQLVNVGPFLDQVAKSSQSLNILLTKSCLFYLPALLLSQRSVAIRIYFLNISSGIPFPQCRP